MSRRNTLTCFLALTLIFLSYTDSLALSLTITPSPGKVNQTESFTVNTQVIVNCNIQIVFGDGVTQDLGNCVGGPCVYNTTHSYTQAGIYTVVGRGNPNPLLCVSPVPAPSDTKILQITNMVFTSPFTLTSGTFSLPFSYQLQTTGGTAPVTYARFSGSLPPGLILETTGLISGTPTSTGTSSFTVRATDATGATVDQTFSLSINLPPVQVTPIPSSSSIASTMGSTQNILYRFTSTPGTSFQLTSPAGQFIAGGQAISTNNQALAVPVQNGSGQVAETIIIPLSVIQRAQANRANTLFYQRTFNPGSVTSTITFPITSEAMAPFTITRLALYFENKRPEITIEKNYPRLKAFAQINFLGSGLLQAYWEVDQRVISYVNQQLAYGQMVTLETPPIPPLPTFDPGTHSVRFVITNPAPQMTLPTILYYVESQESKIMKISSLLPGNNTVWDFRPIFFQWDGLNQSSLYLIEFLKGRDSLPFFSAFTRRPVYEVPEVLLKKIFETNLGYLWKVKGFDSQNNLIGESDLWTFQFK
jgi:hypothetical protein